MSGINNLKPHRIIKAFERDGWTAVKQKSTSHIKLIKKGNSKILTIPVHKGKPVKQGLLRKEISKAGLTVEEFLKLYK